MSGSGSSLCVSASADGVSELPSLYQEVRALVEDQAGVIAERLVLSVFVVRTSLFFLKFVVCFISEMVGCRW